MSVSRAAVHPIACPRCEAPGDVRVWRVIDLQERPDLREELADGAWRTVRCSACGTKHDRVLGLLVLHLSSAAPVLLGVPDGALSLDDPVAPESVLLEETEAALGDRRRDVAGPVVAVPFDVLAAAAGRDLTADLEAGGHPEIDSQGTELARRYAIFVDMIRQSVAERRVNLATDRLAWVTSLQELRDAFADFPELRGTAVRELLKARIAQAESERDRHLAQARADLVRIAAGGRLEDAWGVYERSAQALVRDHLMPRAVALMEELRALEGGDAARAVEIGEELVALVVDVAPPAFQVEALLGTASAHYNTSGPGVEDRLDRVIELCQEALRVIAENPDDDHADALSVERRTALLNMGAAYSRRLRGDPIANLERGCALQREVLAEVTIESDGRVWAMANTNLAMSLVHRAKQRRSGDRERESELIEAIERLEDSLRWRSFERDPHDWAYTQMALGLALANRDGGDRRADLIESIRHHEESARGFAAAQTDELRAQALHNAASEKIVLAGLDGTPTDERARLLDEAADDCRASLELRPVSFSPEDAGRTTHQLAKALELRGDAPAAIAAYRQALDALKPSTAPHACRTTAVELAHLTTSVNDWDGAAEAWEIATEAAVAALESRAASGGRFEELEQQLNLFRWAAYALVRVGRQARAVEVLEQGRARELAVWLQRDADVQELDDLDPELCRRYVELREELEAHERDQRDGLTPDTTAAADAREALRRTVEEIRAIPGMEGFLCARRYGEIAAGVAEREALAYLLLAPQGSAIIVVVHRAQPEVIELPDLSSTQAVRALITEDPSGRGVSGYLVAQAQGSDDLDDAIDEVSGLLGPALLKPLSDRLAALKVTSVCLIGTGLLGLVPIHALAWHEDGSTVCLADRLDVVVSPSALAREVCRRRAAERAGDVRLLAVGNPLPHPRPLPWSGFEATMVADTLPTVEAVTLTGAEASKRAVVAALAGKTHVHLACHGAAAMSPAALDSGLFFAFNEALTASELLDLPGFTPRLVVASACETAINPGYETADEALALSTVLLGAGTAGVVASLWAVDDRATALLMSRFYEELATGARPERALRVAMLWLRDLRREEVIAYINARPALRVYRSGAPRERGGVSENERPYRRPSAWAPFVFSGA